AIIRGVMTEFGAVGPGYSINDAEVDTMFQSYCGERAAYFVVDDGGEIIGGGGVAPLDGAAPEVCELRKMYFLPRARGRGLGRDMLDRCLAAARELGFARCYLETLAGMDGARRLYERAGFRCISEAMGFTGHSSCNRFYVMEL
ncbi:MAG: GNAT family N-acetyltransferase, partial [Gemmatimonadales bacterium]